MKTIEVTYKNGKKVNYYAPDMHTFLSEYLREKKKEQVEQVEGIKEVKKK